MKLLKYILGLVGYKKDIVQEKKEESSIDFQTLYQKYPGLNDVEIYDLLDDKEIGKEEMSAIEKEFLKEMSWTKYAETVADERRAERHLALKGLWENRYKILADESSNPYKEVINFTLQYFNKLIAENPTEADTVLRNAFPVMHPYILVNISKNSSLTIPDNNIDEVKAFNEFLLFCSTLFCFLYPDKRKRGIELKKYFKRGHNDMAHFIEQESQVMIPVVLPFQAGRYL